MIRIKELVEFIGNYKNIADVGCDHGYLIIEAFKKYELNSAIAIDNKKGPLNQAIENIKKYDFYNNVRFSLSSGIKDIDDITEVVVIAGMGGMLISDILNDDLKNVQRLILQPNRDIREVRSKISSLNFKIVNEKVIFENGKYYEIITCDKINDNVFYTEEELEFGPILLKEKNNMFIQKWNNEIEKLENILKNTEIQDSINKKIERIKNIIC